MWYALRYVDFNYLVLWLKCFIVTFNNCYYYEVTTRCSPVITLVGAMVAEPGGKVFQLNMREFFFLSWVVHRKVRDLRLKSRRRKFFFSWNDNCRTYLILYLIISSSPSFAAEFPNNNIPLYSTLCFQSSVSNICSSQFILHNSKPSCFGSTFSFIAVQFWAQF